MTLSASLGARCHKAARADRWHLSEERFRLALEVSLAHHFGGGHPGAAEAEDYVTKLKLQDLALATACADGDEDAWEHVMRELRPTLYRAADAMDGSGGARDVADALWADLYGVKSSGGERQSLFRYFHGRSTLATWMRSVLSQRVVDQVRLRRRTEPLPDDEAPAALVSRVVALDPDRVRWVELLRVVLAAVLGALAPRDRLRLGCYYGQNLKLAAIGRLLHEHEATVSRHLTRTRREIRDEVERRLRDEHHLAPEAIAECFATAADGADGLDLTEVLDHQRKIGGVDRSKEEGGRGV